ncbi:MAG: hypothetical protein ABSG03_25250 [Bryobacteraceae bacterium]|jgi:hypothetical protein
MKDSMRKLLYSAVIAMMSFAPLARAQSKPDVLRAPVAPVQMPEVATPAILAADLVSVGVLIFAFRRRAARTNR